jgi:hypothetical protein
MINQEFLTRDFRHNRPIHFGIPMNDAITLEKHRLLLPPELIQGKRILDIGSFIAQTGDWCLNNGAVSYTGVEINQQFHDTATELLTKYHSDQDWTLINQSLEQYLSADPTQFDIVFCWNVIFGHNDHYWLLKELGRRADHVIISSRHPKIMWNDIQSAVSDTAWKDLEYHVAYQEWQTGLMTQTFAVNGSVYCTAANSSPGAMRVIMELEGFKSDMQAYDKLKDIFPNDFGMFRESKKIGFFVIEFFRDNQIKKHAVLNQMYLDPAMQEKNYVSWIKP